jgi:NitT/TauT family transport system ATP-binding protein
MTRAEAYARARERMVAAGLSGYEQAYPGETSSGVKRRIEIVRALMNDPTVLLLDEPFRALDSLTKSIMHAALLDTHARNQVTTFFITHDIEEAVFLGHKVVVMTSRPCRPKKIVEVDAPHPRDAAWLADRRYRELVRETTAAVHEEALRAFARGEKES